MSILGVLSLILSSSAKQQWNIKKLELAANLRQ